MSEHYIRTFNGIRFDLIEPTEDMVDIIDIIVSLSRTSRYNGHKPHIFNHAFPGGDFYSVAQHSVYTCRIAHEHSFPKPAIVKTLLHDAAEAYIGDIVFPLKRYPPVYKYIHEIEQRIESVIFSKFGVLDYNDFDSFIKHIDYRIASSEMKYFDMGKEYVDDNGYFPYVDFGMWIEKDGLWSPRKSYLKMYSEVSKFMEI